MASVVVTLAVCLIKHQVDNVHRLSFNIICPTHGNYYHPFDSERDAQSLKKAFNESETDDKVIVRIIGNRTYEQRQRIAETYANMFGEDLKETLLSGISGNFHKTIQLLFTPLPEYYAELLYDAIYVGETNEDILLEILCTVTNNQIKKIKDAFEEKFERTLEEAIKEDTTGDFKHMILMICKASRNEGVVCLDKVRTDAEALFEAGEAQWSAKEAAFNTLFAFESYEHLRFVFQEYEDITGRSLFEAIEIETSGDLKRALLTIVRCVDNTPSFFARKLRKIIKSSCTNEEAIMRIVVSRCEIDMVFIKSEYEKRFKEVLEDAVSACTSGGFQQMLVALMAH